jgi:hypothetical protein
VWSNGRGASWRTTRHLGVKAASDAADAYDVTVDSLTGAAPDRCPRCAALVRPGSQWCTLCYADLRPAPTPATEPTPQSTAAPQPTTAAASSDMFDPLTAPLALLERGAEEPASLQAPSDPMPNGAGWPCATCGATVPLDEPTCTSCGAGFLEGTLPVDPVLGRLSKGAASNQAKVLIMVGGSVGLLVLILGAMYVLGAIF